MSGEKSSLFLFLATWEVTNMSQSPTSRPPLLWLSSVYPLEMIHNDLYESHCRKGHVSPTESIANLPTCQSFYIKSSIVAFFWKNSVIQPCPFHELSFTILEWLVNGQVEIPCVTQVYVVENSTNCSYHTSWPLLIYCLELLFILFMKALCVSHLNCRLI